MTIRRPLLALSAVLTMAGVSACAATAPVPSPQAGTRPPPATSPGVSAPADAYTSSLRLSGPAPANGATLEADAFAVALSRPGTVVLDVRTPAEFFEGHLEGAKNIDVESADFEKKVSALDRKAPYAVYCRSGNRSAAALETMRGLGFTSTYHLGGGIGAWQTSGRPVVK